MTTTGIPPLYPRIPLIASGRVRGALQLAEKAHRGVNRKTGDHPYLLHPVAVATVLAAVGADDDLVIAAFLHDVPEDTDYTLMFIEDQYGSRVAGLVASVTKPEYDNDGRKLTKAEKNRLTLERMSQAEADEAALKAADLLVNTSDLVLDQQQYGYAHWEQLFGTNADAKLQHYLQLAEILLGRLAFFSAYPHLAHHLRNRAEQLRQLYQAWER